MYTDLHLPEYVCTEMAVMWAGGGGGMFKSILHSSTIYKYDVRENIIMKGSIFRNKCYNL